MNTYRFPSLILALGLLILNSACVEFEPEPFNSNNGLYENCIEAEISMADNRTIVLAFDYSGTTGECSFDDLYWRYETGEGSTFRPCFGGNDLWACGPVTYEKSNK
jgi:hypothetical protein